MFSALFYIPLIIILLISTYTDLRRRLIYNWTTFPGMFYFLFYHVLINTNDVFNYVLGFFVLGGISIIIDLFTKSIGGGDIKLFALLGLAFGLQTGLYVYFYSFASAVVIGLPLLILNKLFPNKIKVKSIPMAPFMAIGTMLTYIDLM